MWILAFVLALVVLALAALWMGHRRSARSR
jgi:hypothetical protein